MEQLETFIVIDELWVIRGNVEVVTPVRLLPCSDNKLSSIIHRLLLQLQYDALHSIYWSYTEWMAHNVCRMDFFYIWIVCLTALDLLYLLIHLLECMSWHAALPKHYYVHAVTSGGIVVQLTVGTLCKSKFKLVPKGLQWLLWDGRSSASGFPFLSHIWPVFILAIFLSQVCFHPGWRLSVVDTCRSPWGDLWLCDMSSSNFSIILVKT